MVGVILDHQTLHPAQRRPHRRRLHRDSDAVAILLDHPGDPRGDLTALATARRFSRATPRNIEQNLAFAFL